MIYKNKNVGSRSISAEFIYHVLNIYRTGLANIIKDDSNRNGINTFVLNGLPAYIMCVASVEAFINETYLNNISRIININSPIWEENLKRIERLPLELKIIKVPEMLFQKSFEKHAQPYQDMSTLIKIRNDIVHYKMSNTIPKYILPLIKKKILLTSPDSKNLGIDYLWQDQLSCTEGIRWAFNTSCAIVHKLFEFTKPTQKKLIEGSVSNFKIISTSFVEDILKKNNINPYTNNLK